MNAPLPKAGLTLAIELALRSVSFRLIEKMPAPFAGSRGKGIQPRTLEIFEDLGVLDRMFAVGDIFPRLRTYRDDGSYLDSDFSERLQAAPAEPYPRPLMVPQFLTERIFREQLCELGHRAAFGCALFGFEQDDGGVTARISGPAGGETLRARYLVGADGGRSLVRKTLGVDFPGKTLGAHAIVADVALTGLNRDAWHRFNSDDITRMVMICPLAGTDLFQIQAPIPPDAPVDLLA